MATHRKLTLSEADAIGEVLRPTLLERQRKSLKIF
jgi:hypothetical protein